jgi:hypothetical protein
VNGSENPDTDGVAAVLATQGEPRHGIFLCLGLKGAERFALHAGKKSQWLEQPLQRTATRFQLQMFCEITHCARQYPEKSVCHKCAKI